MKIVVILDKGSRRATLRSQCEKRKPNEVRGGHVDNLGKVIWAEERAIANIMP